MEVISLQMFNQWVKDSEVLLAVRGKPRILRFADNTIVKIFNSKRHWRHSYKFINNAQRLNQMGFATVEPGERFYCSEEDFIYLTYPYVDGRSVYDYLTNRDESILPIVARFMAKLHEHGVYFRGCHPEHLIHKANDDFVLIDIHDTRFFWFPLTINLRLKNLMVLFYRRNIANIISANGMDAFLTAYGEAAGFNENKLNRFKKKFAWMSDQYQNTATVSTPLPR